MLFIRSFVCSLYFIALLRVPLCEGTLAATSVTRFGEISPLWLIIQSFEQYFEGTFSNWLNFETNLANCACHWATFICCK